MFDVCSEEILSLSKLADRLGIHRKMLYQWIVVGVEGVKLDAVTIGAYYRTSAAAVRRFQQLSNHAPGQAQRPHRRRQLAHAAPLAETAV